MITTEAGLYVITPSAHDGPSWNYFSSAMGDYKTAGGMIWTPVLNNPVDYARNGGVKKMLRTSADQFQYVLFVDDDAGWAKGTIHRMIERLQNSGVDAVTGCIYQRANPPICTAGDYKGINTQGHHYYDLTRIGMKIIERAKQEGLTNTCSNMLLLDQTDEDLLEIDGCGAHFLMVKRKVFEFLPEPWFESNAQGGGEDFFFCRLMKEYGYRIWIDLSIHISHEIGRGISSGIRDWVQFAHLAGGIEPILEYYQEIQELLT